MDGRDIIRKPIVSEKSYVLIEENVYTFEVHPEATKPQIREAVEQIFGVRVTKVNTLNRKGKRKSCLLYTSPSPRDQRGSRMPSSA